MISGLKTWSTRRRVAVLLGSAGLAGALGMTGMHSSGGVAVSRANSRPAALALVPGAAARAVPRLGVPVRGTRRAATEGGSGVAHRVVRAYLQGKGNAFFNLSSYLHNMVLAEPGVVAALHAYLLDRHVPTNPTAGRPPERLERLAAIDLLEGVARSDLGQDPLRGHETEAAEAEEALANLVTQPLPADAPGEVRRMLAAEKHGALVALTRVDSARAFDVFGSLPPDKLTVALQDALVAGLVDRGLPRIQAVDMARGAAFRAPLP